jgi:hypothetical protein
VRQIIAQGEDEEEEKERERERERERKLFKAAMLKVISFEFVLKSSLYRTCVCVCVCVNFVTNVNKNIDF